MNGGERPDPFDEGQGAGIPGAPTAPVPGAANPTALAGAAAAGPAAAQPSIAQPGTAAPGLASAFAGAAAQAGYGGAAGYAGATGYPGAAASPYTMQPYGSTFGSGYGSGYGSYGAGGYGSYGGGFSSMLGGGYGGYGAAGYSAGAYGARGAYARGAPLPPGAGVLGGVQEAMARFARVSALVEDALRSLHLLFDALFGLGVSASAFSRELAVLLQAKTGPGAFIARCIRRLGRLWRLLMMVFVSPIGGRYSPVAVALRVLGLVPEGEPAVGEAPVEMEVAWPPREAGGQRLQAAFDPSNI